MSRPLTNWDETFPGMEKRPGRSVPETSRGSLPRVESVTPWQTSSS